MSLLLLLKHNYNYLCFSYNDLKQYIQVDFLAPYYIGGVVTQGRVDEPQWVTKYELYYSTDGKHYTAIPTSPLSNIPMVFIGNADQVGLMMHKFPLISARWIRFVNCVHSTAVYHCVHMLQYYCIVD